ncbi:Predicted arabinose efflux permease, MFS family [Sporobacter termitidis DSM 10068]|uniref:Predicted arabinose efflux permease, MFS family n=1 Tax=Sporobacter termitidis DSM 10068 TaxID=1123282 RepID=A0A1M5UEB2_9FIRM|nr:MFS transporter [Sporobacter termitidis]SHH61395.1 Predicted arabinose efflux permease, MFS family [Sporobacter termitidis DSM 10068]
MSERKVKPLGHKEKLWTRSFIILWQSQLVSLVGDAVYSIALGFWILQVTGSTALMGTLMATSTLPGILLSPFAGVLIDRSNKKALMIVMDAVRGVAVLLLSAAAYAGLIQIWMVFVAGILLSAGGAVFTPGVQSSVPDLVPTSRVANANSIFATVSTGANLIGNAAGGFLFQALGAPLLFLVNGLTFLFSGASLPFVKIPNVRREETPHFFKDMTDGFRFMWRQKGLRIILIIAALINFFSFIAITLFMPFANSNPALGTGRYGVLMACFMGGSVLGFLALSMLSIKPKDKMRVFITASVVGNILLIAALNQPFFVLMAVLLVFAGVGNAVVNVLLVSTVQMSTPQEMRGKVMSFMSTTTGGLTPFAMALGGVLGGVLPILTVITAALAVAFAATVPAYFSKSFKAYLTEDRAGGTRTLPENI